MHKRTLRDNGVKILSAMENIPDTPEGIILESLLEGMAEYYSAELSQKVRRGMNESRQKGNFTGGYVLYGYKIVDKKVVIDEAKAELNGVTLESLVVAERVARAVKAASRLGKIDASLFPLLMHVDDILKKKTEVNIPWEKFTFEYIK